MLFGSKYQPTDILEFWKEGDESNNVNLLSLSALEVHTIYLHPYPHILIVTQFKGLQAYINILSHQVQVNAIHMYVCNYMHLTHVCRYLVMLFDEIFICALKEDFHNINMLLRLSIGEWVYLRIDIALPVPKIAFGGTRVHEVLKK